MKVKLSNWLLIAIFPLLAFKCVKSHPSIEIVNKTNGEVTIDSISNIGIWTESINLKIPIDSNLFYDLRTPFDEIRKDSINNYKLFYTDDSGSNVIDLTERKLKAFNTKKLILK